MAPIYLKILAFLLLQYGVWSQVLSRPGCQAYLTCTNTTYANFSDWTRGVFPGDENFDGVLTCLENVYLCGYVPSKTSGSKTVAIETKGVTISTGIDLGQYSLDEMTSILSDYGNQTNFTQDDFGALMDKLTPFCGLLGQEAANFLLYSFDLQITLEEHQYMYNAFYRKNMDSLLTPYNADNKMTNESLPICVEAAALSYTWEFKSIKDNNQQLWNALINHNWDQMSAVLEGMTTNTNDQDLALRKSENQLITSCTRTCTKSLDIAFLIDESGSIGSTNFQKARDFLSEFIEGQQDVSANRIRIAISKFSTGFTPIVSLSNGTDKQNLVNLVQNTSYAQGGTNTGAALNKFIDILMPQNRFEESVPLAIIVMTDGLSYDQSVLIQAAARAKSYGIQMYAVGVGPQINTAELSLIANNDSSNVISVESYSELSQFLSTIAATSCNTPVSPPLNTPVQGNITSPTEYLLYQFTFNISVNCVIKVVPLNGTNVANIDMFSSFSDTHPDPLGCDSKYMGTSRDDYKQMILSATSQSTASAQITSRILQANSTTPSEQVNQTVYVSIRGSNEGDSFTITASECDKKTCRPGLNDFMGFSIIRTWGLNLLAPLVILLIIKNIW